MLAFIVTAPLFARSFHMIPSLIAPAWMLRFPHRKGNHPPHGAYVAHLTLLLVAPT